MADFITINQEKHWSAATWIARLVIRAIHAFLPRYDSQRIAQQFENFQNGAHPDLTDFTSSEMQVICGAALQAYEHALATGLSSDIFKQPDFTPSDDFLQRFCPKFEQFIQLLSEDDRVDIATARTKPKTHMIGAKQPDPRVKSLLDQLELKPTVDDAGTYSVIFEFEDGRTQEVHIASETTYLDKLEIRDIYSFGLSSDTPLHADVSNALLAYNADTKIGAWELLRRDDDSCTACFRIPIAANTTANALLSALESAAKSADWVEEKFTGEDRY